MCNSCVTVDVCVSEGTHKANVQNVIRFWDVYMCVSVLFCVWQSACICMYLCLLLSKDEKKKLLALWSTHFPSKQSRLSSDPVAGNSVSGSQPTKKPGTGNQTELSRQGCETRKVGSKRKHKPDDKLSPTKGDLKASYAGSKRKEKTDAQLSPAKEDLKTSEVGSKRKQNTDANLSQAKGPKISIDEKKKLFALWSTHFPKKTPSLSSDSVASGNSGSGSEPPQETDTQGLTDAAQNERRPIGTGTDMDVSTYHNDFLFKMYPVDLLQSYTNQKTVHGPPRPGELSRKQLSFQPRD
eukprot:GHVQ01000945.1.p1 GENE.GHVQ01000945.1~~GHVQ01000945.1.p1  ORF type:complete len:296 (-),score=30.94 GHVQ01000945.1:630-1517(-)